MLENIKYKLLENFHKKPLVLNNAETIEKILEGYSISRFVDGEFFLMIKEKGFDFQSINDNLSNRLLEVFNSNEERLLVAIPKVFEEKDLEFRTEASKQWWKNYLRNYRELWYKYIDFKKIYGSSTFTRNYIAVEDKSICKEYFESIKKIWNDKEIIIVEGKYSRLGIGNDLFNEAKSIQRILAPNKNAFDKYNEILNRVKLESQDKLILIALGPTATILAYDLHKLGYQAIDIGHIDIEYEWFLQGTTEKTKVKNKYTYEASGVTANDNFKDEIYESQIISVID